MKTNNLCISGVEELSASEEASITGGTPWVAFAVTYIFIQALMNPTAHIDAFLQGVSEGYNAVKSTQ